MSTRFPHDPPRTAPTVADVRAGRAELELMRADLRQIDAELGEMRARVGELLQALGEESTVAVAPAPPSRSARVTRWDLILPVLALVLILLAAKAWAG